MERLSDQPKSPEQAAEMDALAAERLRQLEQQAEIQTPESAERQVEAAREVIAQQPEVQHPAHETTPAEPTTPGLMNRALNYKLTMQSLQRQLHPASRRFSKVIHKPVVERTSEVMERTIMRPSVTLGATSTAFVVGVFTYWMARHYGFALSGSEIILSLLFGGALGIVIEGLIRLIRRPRP